MLKNTILAAFALYESSLTKGTVEAIPSQEKNNFIDRNLMSFQVLADSPTCIHNHYSLSWFVIDHIRLVATPSGDSDDAACTQTFVFDDSLGGKQTMALADAPTAVANFQDDSISLGDFTLQDIVHAFDNAESGTASSLQPNYDVVTSNCASFIMNMIGELGMIVDELIMNYTARRLATESQGYIAALVRESPNLHLLGMDAPDEASDGVLLNSLVRRYVKEYYQENDGRKLNESTRCGTNNTPFESEEIALAHHTKCAETDYDVHIGTVKGHICLFAAPSIDDSKGCESVRFHLCDPEFKSIDKRSWDDFADGSTFLVDTYKFGDLVNSYNNFVPIPKEFDIVTNNVGTLIVDMLCSLGVEVDDSILNFVTDRLIVDEETIMKDISESSNQQELKTIALSENDPYIAMGENATVIRKLVKYSSETSVTSYCSEQLSVTPSASEKPLISFLISTIVLAAVIFTA